MGRDVRFLVFNTVEECAKDLRAGLMATPRAKIVAEVDEPALLPQAVSQFHVAAILVNIDPKPELVFPALTQIAEEHPEVAILATSTSTDGPLILKVMRLGAREFIPRPIDSDALADAIEKLAAQRVHSAEDGKLVTVMGASGGVGATFFATNLAVELAKLCEGSVTVVDLDYRFGQVATLLDIDPTFTLADLCDTPEQLEQQVLDRALVKHSSGVKVLSRPSSFAEADTMTAASCVALLSTLVQHNDFVVVDGPNRSDIRARSVLDIADHNILLVQLLVPCIRNATRIMSGMRDNNDGVDKMMLIPNRLGRQSSDLSIEDASQTLNLDVFASVPDDWATVSGSINLGEPLMTQSPKSKVRVAIEEIAQRLYSPDSQADEDDDGKKSLIGRIFAH
ncbi:MAG: AAA family ATPase [Planctomycetota bacterium]|jgi:pilus assembly protein CpaE